MGRFSMGGLKTVTRLTRLTRLTHLTHLRYLTRMTRMSRVGAWERGSVERGSVIKIRNYDYD